MNVANEVFAGIRAVKVLAWETPFSAQLQDIRTEELIKLRRLLLVRTLNFLVSTITPILIAVGTFTMYSLLGNRLTAAKVFTSLALFNLLRKPMQMYPRVMNAVLDAWVSIKRLQTYLLEDEVHRRVFEKAPSPEAVRVSFTQASFGWAAKGNPALHLLDLAAGPGAFVCVVGAVGCGKSALLSALLGELHNQGGTTEVVGTVAYVPQQPFIVNATLRDNILFGTPYDASRYQSAVVACQMEDDLKLLPFGDLTEIGERGINLSMGQKMRVALARAVYYDADIYLIDDALAAVDVHVGKQIFERVFIGLLAHKTRIVVTNQLHNLDHAAEVLVLEAGRVAERGTLAELMAKGLAFSDLVERHTAPTASTEPHDDNTNTNIDIDIDDEANAVTKRRSRVWSDDFDDQAVELLATQRASGQRVSGERASGVRKNSTEGGTVAMQPKGLGHAASSVLMTTEEKGKGRIALLNWLDYFAAQVIQKQAPPQSRP